MSDDAASPAAAKPAIARWLDAEPWAESAIGRPCFRLSRHALNELAARRRHEELQAKLATAEPCLVSADVPMSDLALAQSLAQAGFYAVGTELNLRIDAAHGDKLADDDTLRLRLVASRERSDWDRVAWEFNFARRGPWHDERLDADRQRRWFSEWITQLQRRGGRPYVVDETKSEAWLGVALIWPRTDKEATIAVFATSRPEGDTNGNEMARLVVSTAQRQFAQGRRVVNVRLLGHDTSSLNTLLDLRFLLDRAYVRWHGWFPASLPSS